jgi:thiol-disulfide isomerase/thioredoxin
MMKRSNTMKKEVVILALLVLSLAISGQAAEQIKPLELGQLAPDFKLPGVDGKEHCLADFADAKILVVIFTCNHCPTAQAYEERIKKLVSDYKERRVAFVAISPNDPKAIRLDELGYTDLSDSFEGNKIRARDHAFNFPYLYDGDKQEVSRAYGPGATPHVFIFDGDRKLRYRGGIDDSERPDRVRKHHVRNALDALLAGKAVPEADTRVFGCSIKWASKRDAVKNYMERLAAEKVGLEEIGPEEVKALMKNDSNKLRLISFWSIQSDSCRNQFGELVTINRMYRGRSFELITICVEELDRKEGVLAFLKEKQASNRNTIFDKQDKNRLLEATDREWTGAVPFTLLVKPGGNIVYKRLGEMDPLKTKRAIVEILGRTY